MEWKDDVCAYLSLVNELPFVDPNTVEGYFNNSMYEPARDLGNKGASNLASPFKMGTKPIDELREKCVYEYRVFMCENGRGSQTTSSRTMDDGLDGWYWQ